LTALVRVAGLFGFVLGFVWSLISGLVLSLALGLKALAFAALDVEEAVALVAFNTRFSPRLPLFADSAAAFPLFVLFAMMSVVKPPVPRRRLRGVLATAPRTFQAFLSLLRRCHRQATLLSSASRQRGERATWAA
jgi:hypothetical protein